MKRLFIFCCALFLLISVAQPVVATPIGSPEADGKLPVRENPFRYFLHANSRLLEVGFRAGKPERVRVTLLNVDGEILSETRSIISSVSPNVYVKAAAFAPGIYLLDVRMGSQHYVEKVVIG
jgi:hypothetical protein